MGIKFLKILPFYDSGHGETSVLVQGNSNKLEISAITKKPDSAHRGHGIEQGSIKVKAR
jgi:hypothetical protein